jgi:hypothetical protein
VGDSKRFHDFEVLGKKYRISGIPKDHFFQDVFEISKVNKKMLIDFLSLQTANTPAQDAAQIP